MLMRFDPFREADRFAEQAWAALRPRTPTLPVDVIRNGDAFEVRLDVPGVDPEGVEVTIEDKILTIRAERIPEEVPEGVEVLVSERPTGHYTRQLFLGDGLDTDKVEARYDRGVLTVTIPVAERIKPRRLQINVAERADAIEGATHPTPEVADSAAA